jgi:serine/threonine protein kinase
VFVQPSDSSFNSLFDSEHEEDAVPGTPISYPSYPKLSDFYFTKVLGHGSFGTVYLARSRYNRHPSAIKVTSKRNVVISSIDESLKAEAKVLASLDHPFIIKIEFAFQNQDFLFIGLQVATNGTLSNYLDAYAVSTDDSFPHLSFCPHFH